MALRFKRLVAVLATAVALAGCGGGSEGTTTTITDPIAECTTNKPECRIDNYEAGNGRPARCADGLWSKSGGVQGACSHHGGLWENR